MQIICILFMHSERSEKTMMIIDVSLQLISACNRFSSWVTHLNQWTGHYRFPSIRSNNARCQTGHILIIQNIKLEESLNFEPIKYIFRARGPSAGTMGNFRWLTRLAYPVGVSAESSSVVSYQKILPPCLISRNFSKLLSNRVYGRTIIHTSSIGCMKLVELLFGSNRKMCSLHQNNKTGLREGPP